MLLDMDMFLSVSQFGGVLCKWEARAGDDGWLNSVRWATSEHEDHFDRRVAATVQ
jgi:hypothetical protein